MKSNLIKRIERTGIDKAQNADEPNIIILTNKISLLLSLLPLIYITVNVIINGWSRITIPIIAQPAFFLLPILFNYFGSINGSRLVLSWIMALQAMIFSIYNKSHGFDHQTSHYIGIQFSILASTIIPFLIFNLKDRVLILFSLSIPILSLILFDAIHSIFGVGYYQVGLNESGYALTTMRVMIGFILIFGSSLSLKHLVEEKEQINRELIKHLSEKNNEVLAQLEEITSQNEYISLQKSELEKKNDIIQVQNDQLLSAKENLEQRVNERTRDLVDANTELDKKNTQLENFAFMAAHNLRAPIARILGLINVLGLPTSNSTEKNKILTLIGQSAENLDDVIKDLVAVVQIGDFSIGNVRKIKLNDVINSVLTRLNVVSEHPEVQVVNKVNPDFELETNEVYANAVLYGVLNNSLKYKSEKDSVITIDTYSKSPYSVVEVIDNGIGFDATLHREKIFKPFTKLNDKFPGKGLGLYMVKIQMENMGGHVSIESEKDKGTILKLMFPENPSVN